jgi:transposase
MNTTNSASTQPATEFVAYIGLDWGDETHAFALGTNADQQSPQTGTLINSPEALHSWLDELAQRFAGRPVALALETSRGPLVHLFSAYPWLTLFPIHPITSARYRSAFKPSGAKDDQPDALLLLELVRDQRHKLRPLQLCDSATRQLAALVELRRDLVDRRTQVVLQLTSLLKSYFPQALELLGHDLTTGLALAFLRRWPDALALKATRPSSLENFYYKHSVRSETLVAKRLSLLQKLRPLTTDEAVLMPARLHLAALLEQLRVFAKHIDSIEKQIVTLFKNHPEAYLFRDLPGAAKVFQPRLLVAFGQDRSIYPNPASLQKYGGLAPVIEKSGRQKWVHWRWQAPRFLRQTFVEWAGQTAIYSSWAREYYQAMEAKGKSRQVILRALAFKWIRVLWKCWQTRTPYDEALYLRQLLARKSPHGPKTVS